MCAGSASGRGRMTAEVLDHRSSARARKVAIWALLTGGGDCANGSGCDVAEWVWERSVNGRTWQIVTKQPTGSWVLNAEMECHQARVRVHYSDTFGPHDLTSAVGGTGELGRVHLKLH